MKYGRPVVLIGCVGCLLSLLAPWFSASLFSVEPWTAPGFRLLGGWLSGLFISLALIVEVLGRLKGTSDLIISTDTTVIVFFSLSFFFAMANLLAGAFLLPLGFLEWGVIPVVVFHVLGVIEPIRAIAARRKTARA